MNELFQDFGFFMIPCANMTLKSLVCLKYLMQMKTDCQMESSYILWLYIIYVMLLSIEFNW